MKLTQSGDRYIFSCRFEEKDTPKQAGFQWDPNQRQWYTTKQEIAAKLGQYGDADVRYALGEMSEEYYTQLQASRADTSDIELVGPEDLNYLPYQRAGIQYALQRPATLIADEMGLGKAQPLHTPVLTPGGFVRMGDLRRSDWVIGRNGKPTQIRAIYPQGYQNTCRVTLNDGTWTLATGEHLWTIFEDLEDETPRVMNTQSLLAELELNPLKHFYLPEIAPVHQQPFEAIIPPYLLGLILGRGSTCNKLQVYYQDDAQKQEILAMISAIPEAGQVREYASHPNRLFIQKGRLVDEIRNLELWNRQAPYRFIPACYLHDDVPGRLALLKGLLEARGKIVGERLRFYGARRLCEDVAQLVRSLGGFARLVDHHDDVVFVSLNLSHRLLRGLRPELLAYRDEASHYFRRHIVSIEPEGRYECQCLRVSAPDKLYLTQSYIPTHNTVQALGYINNQDKLQPGDRILIICPASLKINWYRECLRWLVKDFTIGTVKDEVKDKEGNVIDNGWPDTQVVICNYDRLDKYLEIYSFIPWKLVICDEAHMLKNRKAKRSQLVYDHLNPPFKLFLTGTPIMNRPLEIFELVSYLNPDLFPSLYSFAYKYCESTPTGFGIDRDTGKNLDELQEVLRLNVMIRRLKEHVLPDLPPKVRQVIEIPPSKGMSTVFKQEERFMREHSKLLNELLAIIQKTPVTASISEYEASINRLKHSEPAAFNQLAKLRIDAATKKIKLVADYALELIEDDPDKKILIFAHHKEVIDGLVARLGPLAVKLDGRDGETARQRAVDRFQDDPSIRFFIGSMEAAGVGLTLTRANHVLFAEYSWVPAIMLQAEDRAHRIGQKDCVTVQMLVSEGSIEARMAKAIVRKLNLINQALDRESGLVASQRPAAISFTRAQRQAIHDGLRALSKACDGAAAIDGRGFSRADATFGKSLAQSRTLSDRQTESGYKLLKKYHQQLSPQLLSQLEGPHEQIQHDHEEPISRKISG